MSHRIDGPLEVRADTFLVLPRKYIAVSSANNASWTPDADRGILLVYAEHRRERAWSLEVVVYYVYETIWDFHETANPPAYKSCIRFNRGGVAMHFAFFTHERHLRSVHRFTAVTTARFSASDWFAAPRLHARKSITHSHVPPESASESAEQAIVRHDRPKRSA
ncbi:hypothetical protein EVAR_56618_1 [Eumeta japonica]|uniref:Uncharacterized protein n=1 Tax=Eumeta variegata TaxID=151549 RepID=A0A4C1XLT8_EUMVA|nr:hypothetical protein EVAR_56618_1 [Eumeta japonica]